MKLALLGAGGLLGRHLVEEFAGEREVRALDRAACDVAKFDEVLERTAGAELIVNCAAFTDVDGAEARPDDAWRTNALGAENAARAAVRHGAALLHLSTDFVLAGDQDAPQDESAPTAPRSAYARGKFAGEELVARAGGRFFIARVQALYGAGGRGFSSRLPSLIREAQAKTRTLTLDAERRVQPTWARAAARQLARLARTDGYGLYHVSCHGETTWAGFARALAERLGVKPSWREVPTAALAAPAARPRNCLFDHKMLRLRGLDILPDWRVALDEYLAEIS